MPSAEPIQRTTTRGKRRGLCTTQKREDKIPSPTRKNKEKTVYTNVFGACGPWGRDLSTASTRLVRAANWPPNGFEAEPRTQAEVLFGTKS